MAALRTQLLQYLPRWWNGVRRAVGAMLSPLTSLGSGAVGAWEYASFLVAALGAVLWLALLPSTWRRTVRNVLARQLLFTAVDGLAFCMRIAAAVGIMLIVQAELWVRNTGGQGLLGPLLFQAIVRELGPLLASFLVIVRSGNAITTELAGMRLAGEVDVLDAQGIDPTIYLVVPRAVGVSLSVFLLAVVFVATTFVSGYVVGMLMGVMSRGPAAFFDQLFAAAGREDLYFFLPKTLLVGLVVGTICAVEGLSVRRAATEVPQAASRSATRSLTAVFAVSAVLSLLLYGRILIFEVS